jgi:hypothetical protein
MVLREDGRIVGGVQWQEKVHNREEWKKLLRTARNCLILHMPTEGINSNEFHMHIYTLCIQPLLSPMVLECTLSI